jgi:endoglucanase
MVRPIGPCHVAMIAVLAVSALGLAPRCSAAESSDGQIAQLPFLTGVNLASPSFGPQIEKGGPRGRHGREYTYPIARYTPGYQSHVYFLSKGMNTFRIPVLWERLQPKLDGGFNPFETKRLKDTVRTLTGLGAYVVLDVHNYARYEGQLIGTADVPVARFAALWSSLASEFKDDERVFFNIMNEPHGIDARSWTEIAQTAIDAIRETGARNLLLIPGINFTGASHWNDDGNGERLLDLRDPADNTAFDAHTYLNARGTGLDEDCVDEEIGVARLKPFVDWLKQNDKRGFVGEFGAGRGSVCLAALENMARYMLSNSDVLLGWTYWAAGPWWPEDYFTSVEPRPDGSDAPQLAALLPFIGTSAASGQSP